MVYLATNDTIRPMNDLFKMDFKFLRIFKMLLVMIVMIGVCIVILCISIGKPVMISINKVLDTLEKIFEENPIESSMISILTVIARNPFNS